MRPNNADLIGLVNHNPSLSLIERNGVLTGLQQSGFTAVVDGHDAFKLVQYGRCMTLPLMGWQRAHLSDLKRRPLRRTVGQRPKRRNPCCARPLVVGARTIGIFRKDVGPADSDDVRPILNPCMSGPIIIGKAFAPRRHAQWFSQDSVPRGYEISISYWYDRYESNSVSVYQYNQSSGSETEIGTYYETNSTAFFQLSDASADELWLSVNYYNPELDDYGAVDTFETLFCFLPFIYLAGVIAAFVRGNKALAYGLLTPLMLWFALMGAIILMLIAFW